MRFKQVNNPVLLNVLISGNIITDVSDHFSQFCILKSNRDKPVKKTIKQLHSKYKYYRNKITNLIRLSKKRYYYDFFEKNTNNMKKTWKVINELLNNQRTKSRVLTKVKDPTNNNQITQNPSRLPNILNKHFANVGNLLASKLPKKDNYMSYLSKLKSPDSSFFFKPICK